MNFILDDRGFAISPFVIVVLIILGVSIAVYFMEIDNNKAKSILIEGQINSAILNTEEIKAVAQTSALFASYQSAYDVGKKGGTKQELEYAITKNLNNYSNFSSDEGVKTNGNFTVFVEPTDEGYFIVKTNRSPESHLGKTQISIKSNISIEKFVDTRFFLLYNLSENFNETQLIDSYSSFIYNYLVDSFDFQLLVYTTNNDTVTMIGTINNSNYVNNGTFAKNIFEFSIIDLERYSTTLYPNITGSNCALAFKPDLISVDVSKEYTSNSTVWEWKTNVSLNGSIFDKSLVNETQIPGIFYINTTHPIILREGTLLPLEYTLNQGKSFNLFYDIHLIMYNATDTRTPDNYTIEMFNNETHFPIYFYLI